MGLLARTSSRSSRPRASTRTRSASSRPRRTSPSGCSNGGSRPIAPGWRWRRSSWAKLDLPAIDYQDAYYYAEPKAKPKLGSLDEVDPEILRVYEKLGIPIEEQKVLAGVEGARKVAVDAVFDSVSVATTFREELKRAGRHLPVDQRGDPRVSRAGPQISRQRRPAARQLLRLPQQRGLLRRHLRLRARGRPLPDGTVSTYFRINAENTGQFERTLIVADKGSYVSYLEGCTAPMRDENQLHAAVVEIFAHEDAEVKYSTVQNWYPGDAEGKGGIFNFVTKRALCSRRALEGQLDPGRDRQRDHLEISELHPQGRRQRRRILFGRADQQPPAGRHRHQDDAHRRQHALDDRLQGHQRGPLATTPIAGWCACFRGAENVRNFTQCDSLLLGERVRRPHRALHRGQEPDRDRSSMKRPRRRSATTNCSTR